MGRLHARHRAGSLHPNELHFHFSCSRGDGANEGQPAFYYVRRWINIAHQRTPDKLGQKSWIYAIRIPNRSLGPGENLREVSELIDMSSSMVQLNDVSPGISSA